jgi:hypothetical protein
MCSPFFSLTGFLELLNVGIRSNSTSTFFCCGMFGETFHQYRVPTINEGDVHFDHVCLADSPYLAKNLHGRYVILKCKTTTKSEQELILPVFPLLKGRFIKYIN